MTGRRGNAATHATAVRPRPKLLAGIAAGAVAAASVAAAVLATSAPANAAPKPNYHAGKDTATFTALGVLDRNCLVSAGGRAIWIKPGDKIDFKSTLAGIDTNQLALPGLLNDLTGKIAGLNVTAKIGKGSSAQTVKVAGGKTTTFPSSGQQALGKGDHKISWTVTSVALVPGLLKASVPLSSSALKSGAKLSWSGVVHVTNSAPKCKLGVSVPKVEASVGRVKVKVPQRDVNVPGTLPNKLPSAGDLTKLPGKVEKATKGAAKPKSSSSARSTGSGYELPGKSVPEQVVPSGGGAAGDYAGGGGGGGFNGLVPNSGGGAGVDSSTLQQAGAGTAKSAKDSDAMSPQTVDLAAEQAGSGSSQLPVVLAILAIIALALVAGTYARLFLVKRT
ncbi:hypothetical protein SAMN05443575_1973 [Jatrophihabitans endophyticus]|uniref:Htaa protein n=1 Tax=Jatrophihabitans endophyticus TaxID=1206085 RepID=A0A1M5IQJ7_9ACTN|nr:hypothetical protein [Jatrophihabitans endophyticus]SHG30582.1 hypothetical protein SAMN05443575_1973 [Jatrophihabitans endophyticus]